MDQVTWFVAHRYKEFDAVRRFLMLQNPHSAPIKGCDSKFPGKVFGIEYRSGAVQQRALDLQSNLEAVFEQARYCRQNTIDALCAFLKVFHGVIQF